MRCLFRSDTRSLLRILYRTWKHHVEIVIWFVSVLTGEFNIGVGGQTSFLTLNTLSLASSPKLGVSSRQYSCSTPHSSSTACTCSRGGLLLNRAYSTSRAITTWWGEESIIRSERRERMRKYKNTYNVLGRFQFKVVKNAKKAWSRNFHWQVKYQRSNYNKNSLKRQR